MLPDMCFSMGRHAGESGTSKISALNDSNSWTAWTSARIGDRLVFKFPANLPRELNGTAFYGVDIANGRIHPESGFKDLGRVKKIRSVRVKVSLSKEYN